MTSSAWNGMNGQQGGDPAKLATALVRPICETQPRKGHLMAAVSELWIMPSDQA